jgi:hypothetical protein
VEHRFSAAPADAFQGLYYDTSPLVVTPWSAVAVAADVATALLSFNDYGLNHSLLSAAADSAPVQAGDLWSVERQGWLFNGRQGIAALLPTASETLGSVRGFSLAVWFEADRAYSAINEGHNVVVSATTTGGISLRLVFTSGLRREPRLSLKVGRLLPGNPEASESSSDYASSERHFAPGTPNAGGKAEWQVTHLGRTWQHAVLSFAGNGSLVALYWNGKRQTGNWRETPTLGALPVGPLASFSLGFDGGRVGAQKGTNGMKWRYLSGLQGGISDVQTYDFAVGDVLAAGLFVANAAGCPPYSPPPSPNPPRPPP